MSLISGSNSLTPAIAGALDFREAIVEKGLLRKALRYDLEVCSEYDGAWVLEFALMQRESGLWCRKCRVAVRWTVLSKEDISDALTSQSTAFKGKRG